MKLLFFGTTDFGSSALSLLMEKHEVCAVITTSPKPQGRGMKLKEPPLAEFSRANGIRPLFAPADLRAEEFRDRLAGYGADLFVVVAFRILPFEVFSIPRLGTINLHASLLPKYRGPAPVQRAIEAGDQETGVTVFLIDKGVDTGSILLQKRAAIGPRQTAPELLNDLSMMGAQALLEAAAGLAGGSMRPHPQDETQASRAPKLSKEEARIQWNCGARAIFNKIRAFKPFPGTYAVFEEKRLGIEWAEPEGGEQFERPGTVVRVEENSFEVRCGQGTLKVLEVKPEGRRLMGAGAFLRGSRLRAGAVLA